jgi:hypothetical protein
VRKWNNPNTSVSTKVEKMNEYIKCGDKLGRTRKVCKNRMKICNENKKVGKLTNDGSRNGNGANKYMM